MATPLRVLVVEDSEADSELLELELKRHDYDTTMERVETGPEFRRSLTGKPWDIIISDYSLPGFSGLDALEIYKSSGLDIPFILLSGVMGEDIAAEAMVRGAHDYITKDRKARLVPAIERELRESRVRREKKESESRFRVMFDTMAEGVVYQDAAGRITDANPAAESILGLSRDQMQGRTSLDPRWKAVNEDRSPAPADEHPIVVARQSGQAVYGKVMGVFNPRDDRYHWMIVSAVPTFRTGESVPYEVFASFVDITQRKQDEEALRESEERFRKIFEEGPIGMCTSDTSFRFLTVNEAFCQMLGYSRRELTSLSFADITHPDHVAADTESVNRLFRGEIRVYKTEKRYVRKDKKIVWGNLTLTVMRDAAGRFLNFLAIIEDVTERRRAEEENKILARFPSENPFPVLRLSQEGIVLYANEGSRALLQDWGTVVGGVVPPFWREVISHVLKSRSKEIVEATSGALIYSFVVAPIPDAGYVNLYGMDISEQKKADEALRESEKKYRELADSLPSAVFEVDLKGRLTYANRTAFEWFGYSEAEFLQGKTVPEMTELLAEADRRRVALNFRRVLSLGEPSSGEYTALRKDGRTFPALIMSRAISRNGQPTGLRGIIIDITERKKAEETLAAERNIMQSLIDNLPDNVFIKDTQGRIILDNPAHRRLLGQEKLEDVVGKSDRDFFAPELADVYMNDERRIVESGQPLINYEEPTIDQEGAPLWFLTTKVPVQDANGKVTALVGINRDITERKRAGEALRESEASLRSFVDALPGPASLINTQGKAVFINQTLARSLGKNVEDVIGQDIVSFIAPDIAEQRRIRINQVAQTGRSARFEDSRGDRSYINYINPVLDTAGHVTKIAIFSLDITERKQGEDALRKSEEKFRKMFEESPLGVTLYDGEGRLLQINKASLEIFGLSDAAQLQGHNLFKGTTLTDEVRQRMRRGESVKYSATFDFEKVRTLGQFDSTRKGTLDLDYVIAPLSGDEKKPTLGFLVQVQDVTERKRAEAEVERSKNLLKAVIDSTPDWIFVKDPAHRYILVNRSYARALNREPEDLIGREDTQFWPKELCVGDAGQGIQGWHADDLNVLRGLIIHNPDNKAVLFDGTVRDFDTFKIPLREPGGETYGVLGYSRDVTERKKSEEDIRKSLENAEKILRSTVQAMETIVEYRDPYTAGHQERVTKLACDLAREIGLSEEKIENLRIGGMLHDLGKIYVPAEILSKPGKLTEFEYGILKTHPQVGYDILKTIDFPPEVATMVAQHHERINGSGYPRGLKGDEICIEAKCLAVADVMEAMSSHRPYRPALGIDQALDEIITNKGIYYDKSIAEACLKLFKEKGFTFAGKREQVAAPSKA